MDIVVGTYTFNANTLKKISKTKALSLFVEIDKKIVEKAWSEANPKKLKRKPQK